MMKLKSRPCCVEFRLYGLILAFCCGLTALGLAQEGVFLTPEAAAVDPDFALQGEYASAGRGVQVVAQGGGNFLVVRYMGGLPGAGWDKSERDESEEDAAAVRDLIASLQLEKVERQSSTIGAGPPVGAVLLFDGSAESVSQHWQPGARLSADGLLEQGCTTQQTFTDFTAHIEFRLPFMPRARGQGRGNSGAYYQGRYETQVLDSFGLAGKNNETGGIYEISDPTLNMCLPPLVWQTYDVDFTAARWDAQGNKTANARLTVRLNGVVVQQDVEVPRITRAAPVQESPEPGPLYFQDHGNPVRYRNIWVLPRDVKAEARRPRVPSFERFFANGSDNVAGGRLLVGELGCAACHQGLEAVTTKSGPVLSQVGARVQPEWMRAYLTDPHALKPGTTMPHLLAGWSDAERDDAVLKLTNFLASTGKVPQLAADSGMVRKGEKLFHEIGCTACHAPRDGTTVSLATSVPLDGIDDKYTIPTLAEFLKNPHAVRPAGRMPSLNLSDKQPEEIAHYLLKDSRSAPRSANVLFQAYHGRWEQMPDLSALTPVNSGECAGLDIYVAGRNNDFAVRFTGFLHLERGGKYMFHLGSDDGSTLTVDGQRVTDADGIHPHTVSSGMLELTAGVHRVQVDYFEASGEESLSLEIEGPGMPRQDATVLLSKSEVVEKAVASTDPNAFVFDPDLVAPGKELFVELGCVACHEMKVGKEPLVFADERRPEPNGDLILDEGCLSPQGVKRGIPQYDLSPQQLSAIVEFLAGSAPELANAARVGHTLATFNCYACHVRTNRGGPEADRNALFTTTIPEMGDEGRLPPTLDGVGDKLQAGWLKQLLQNGADERDYMRTAMPKFAHPDVDALANAFVEADERTEGPAAEIAEPEHRIKSAGRHLVGEGGLACIKCHSFGPHKATGIQAISLTGMTRRLRQDWFQRYLFDPAKYRPGTRMPTGYPDGVPAIKDVFDQATVRSGADDRNSQPNQQITAIWKFLEDGTAAGVPDGLIAEMVELKPESEPIIYRNFLEGTSPRGIAVGYPEQAHIAWDANRFALRMIWHGRFIDASKHWVGRGPGNQRPLGDHVMLLEDTVPIATLNSLDTPWPAADPRELGYRFQGYELNDRKQPAFIYGSELGQIRDFVQPVAREGQDAGLRRELTVTTDYPVWGYFRAARSPVIEPLADGWYQLAGGVRIRVTGGGTPSIRTSEGQQELLVPLAPANGKSSLVQEIDW